MDTPKVRKLNIEKCWDFVVFALIAQKSIEKVWDIDKKKYIFGVGRSDNFFKTCDQRKLCCIIDLKKVVIERCLMVSLELQTKIIGKKLSQN